MKKPTSATPRARSSSKAYCPDAGDVVWLDLTPARGHEQDGHRPVLVLSPRTYNERSGLCIVCVMTSRAKGYPFEVAMADGGVVLADQVRTAAWASRGASFKEKAPAAVLAEVRAKLKAVAGIP